MTNEPIQDLDFICESIFLGKTINEAKEDDKKEDDSASNPFADEQDDTSTEDTEDNSSDDSTESAEDTSDDTTDNDQPSSESDDESSEDTYDDSDTEDETVDDTDAAGEIASEDYNDVSDFGIELMMLGVQAHFWHVNCGTNGEHEILQRLYYDLESSADKILENVISNTKQSISAGSELSFDFGDLNFDKNECLGILEDVRAEANDLCAKYTDNQALCSILGEVLENISTAIYKLSRFETDETI